MDTFIGVLCLVVLVGVLVFAGNKYSDAIYSAVTNMSYSEMRNLKRDCELQLKRTETCQLVFIKSEE